MRLIASKALAMHMTDPDSICSTQNSIMGPPDMISELRARGKPDAHTFLCGQKPNNKNNYNIEVGQVGTKKKK